MDEKQLQRFLNKIAIEQKFDNFDVKITPVSSGGANYTSRLYRVKISEEGKDDLQLFAKVGVLAENFRNQALIRPYDNEQFVYTKLMKTYRYLEEKHAVSEQDRLKYPKFYGVDMTYLQEILVLEDLTSRGFRSANRFESVDWPYAAAAVTELAKLHALSMAYQHEFPSEFDKTLAEFRNGLFPETDESDSIFDKLISSALTAVREDNKERLKVFLKGQHISISKTYNNMLKPLRCQVLIHVDFRPNNMLHKVVDDDTTEVIPVDYQTIQGGSPIVDLLYFIFTATDGQFRAKYYQKLLNHYQSELGAALARLGLDVTEKYSKEDFEFDMKEKLPFGLLVAVLLLPIVLVPEDQAPSLDEPMELTNFVFETTSDQYYQRLNEVVDDFVEWGVL